MSHSCAQWRGDIGAYIVGALDGCARDRVTRHLAACAGCRADHDELAPVRDLLSLLALTTGGPQPGPDAQQPNPNGVYRRCQPRPRHKDNARDLWLCPGI